MDTKYSGAEWLRGSLKYSHPNKVLSPFACKVADILGQVFRGLYHLDRTDNQRWFGPGNGIQIFLSSNSEIATYDCSELTLLTLLCHDHAIRLSVSVGYSIWKHEDGDEESTFLRYEDEVWHADLPKDQYAHACLVLNFFQRSHDGKSQFSRHPTLEEAVATSRLMGEAVERTQT